MFRVLRTCFFVWFEFIILSAIPPFGQCASFHVININFALKWQYPAFLLAGILPPHTELWKPLSLLPKPPAGYNPLTNWGTALFLYLWLPLPPFLGCLEYQLLLLKETVTTERVLGNHSAQPFYTINEDQGSVSVSPMFNVLVTSVGTSWCFPTLISC